VEAGDDRGGVGRGDAVEGVLDVFGRPSWIGVPLVADEPLRVEADEFGIGGDGVGERGLVGAGWTGRVLQDQRASRGRPSAGQRQRDDRAEAVADEQVDRCWQPAGDTLDEGVEIQRPGQSGRRAVPGEV
jgi:hypothetical protein